MSELVLAGVILSGAWTQLDEIGWIGWLPLVLVAVLDRYYPGRPWQAAARDHSADRAAVVAAGALCSLLGLHLALTFREEFGFGGDEGYHLSATRAFAIYFMRAGPWLLAIVAGYAFLRNYAWRYAATIAMAALIAASHTLPENALFGRYPTAFYLLATPLNVLFEGLRSPYPYSANHVMNTLSLPVWLFVLRPIVIGRWPDWRVLPVALLIYFQPTSLTLLASPLLEPWAIVFALLSLEALAAFDHERRWLAVPMCVVAVCFKETMILLLPPVWLLACVTWRDGRLSLRPGSIMLGVAAVTPFLVYYVIRAELTAARGYVFGGIAAFTQVRALEWIANARAQVGIGGITIAAAAALLTIRSAPLWTLTAVAIAMFFLADTISMPWTGYSRFAVYSLLAICGAVFAALHRSQFDRRTLITICAVIAIAQLPATVRTFLLDFQPDHQRNSLEWRGGLIRMPIRALAARIPTLPGGDRVRELRVTAFATDLISLSVAYPDVAARYALASSASDCACRKSDEAVIGVFEWPANLGNSIAARQAYGRASSVCVAQVTSTCLVHAVERDRTGAAIGVLGIGVSGGAQDNQRAQRGE